MFAMDLLMIYNYAVLLQFSSLGSLDEKWLAELASSMSSGLSEDKTPLGLGEPRIIWPTVEDVRCSLEVLQSRLFRLSLLLVRVRFFPKPFPGFGHWLLSIGCAAVTLDRQFHA